ncbi:hypothetical protein SEA_ZUKO_30 [Streptomyces phage Zuko]|uniref:Uncharacterized protein n=1 Tax=Streptomyces phage Zuko TaxID=2601695 RepID=A0A5J6D6V6_9CAUD|nr:hypothetical protein PP630_gp030 [Streptomyces phage Zuko]QEQ93608.1 hypothetical protein SEA_ZUKO_30 [Streptomyces phage Zuko]
MSIPAGANKVTYRFGVTNPDEVLFDVREFTLGGNPTNVWSLQQTNDQIQTMMDNYLEDVNAAYPASGGYTVQASRTYTCQNVEGDTWPTP